MEETVVGIAALVAGAVFCFAGYRAFRVVIVVWGAFTGFSVGAGAISALTDDAVLAKPLGWIVGVAVAFVFALGAYLYYAVAVVLAFGALGFLIGASVMTALGVEWDWLVVVVAVVVAVAVALLAIVANMPRALLVLVSATAGAAAMVAGSMLLTGALELEDLTRATVTERIDDDWFWWVAYATLAIVGIVVQAATNAREDEVRAGWHRQVPDAAG